MYSSHAALLSSSSASPHHPLSQSSTFAEIAEIFRKKERDIVESCRAEVERLESMLRERDEIIIDIASKYDNLKKDFLYNIDILNMKDIEIEKINETIQSHEQINRNLSIEYESLDRKFKDISGKYNDEKQNSKTILSELMQSMEAMKRAGEDGDRFKKTEIERLTHELKHLKTEKEELLELQRREMLLSFNATQQAKEAQFIAKEREITEKVVRLESGFEYTLAENKALKSSLSELKTSDQACKTELSLAVEANRQLTLNLQELQRTKDSLYSSNLQLKEENESLKNSYNIIEEEKADYIRQLDGFKRDNEYLRSNLDQKSKELFDLTEINNTNNRLLGELKSSLNQKNVELIEIKGNRDKAIMDANHSNEVNKEKLAALTAELETQKKKTMKYEKRLKDQERSELDSDNDSWSSDSGSVNSDDPSKDKYRDTRYRMFPNAKSNKWSSLRDKRKYISAKSRNKGIGTQIRLKGPNSISLKDWKSLSEYFLPFQNKFLGGMNRASYFNFQAPLTPSMYANAAEQSPLRSHSNYEHNPNHHQNFMPFNISYGLKSPDRKGYMESTSSSAAKVKSVSIHEHKEIHSPSRRESFSDHSNTPDSRTMMRRRSVSDPPLPTSSENRGETRRRTSANVSFDSLDDNSSVKVKPKRNSITQESSPQLRRSSSLMSIASYNEPFSQTRRSSLSSINSPDAISVGSDKGKTGNYSISAKVRSRTSSITSITSDLSLNTLDKPKLRSNSVQFSSNLGSPDKVSASAGKLRRSSSYIADVSDRKIESSRGRSRSSSLIIEASDVSKSVNRRRSSSLIVDSNSLASKGGRKRSSSLIVDSNDASKTMNRKRSSSLIIDSKSVASKGRSRSSSLISNLNDASKVISKRRSSSVVVDANNAASKGRSSSIISNLNDGNNSINSRRPSSVVADANNAVSRGRSRSSSLIADANSVNSATSSEKLETSMKRRNTINSISASENEILPENPVKNYEDDGINGKKVLNSYILHISKPSAASKLFPDVEVEYVHDNDSESNDNLPNRKNKLNSLELKIGGVKAELDNLRQEREELTNNLNYNYGDNDDGDKIQDWGSDDFGEFDILRGLSQNSKDDKNMRRGSVKQKNSRTDEVSSPDERRGRRLSTGSLSAEGAVRGEVSRHKVVEKKRRSKSIASTSSTSSGSRRRSLESASPLHYMDLTLSRKGQMPIFISPTTSAPRSRGSYLDASKRPMHFGSADMNT